jgi:ParB family chromosome partitioning protein
VKSGFAHDLDAAVDAMKKIPWATLQDMRGDPEVLSKIDEAAALLRSLRAVLS